MAFYQLRQWRGEFEGREVLIELGYTDGATHHTDGGAVTRMIDNHFRVMEQAVGREPFINDWGRASWNVVVSQPPPQHAVSFDFQWEEFNESRHIRVSVYHIAFAQSVYRTEQKVSLQKRALEVLRS